MPAPHHDFADSLLLARNDVDLKIQLTRFFGTNSLSAPDKSPLVATTIDAMTWVVQQARSMYAVNPERLVAAISSSSKRNALAVWSGSGRDWIILSEGLMRHLRDGVEDVAVRFAGAFPEIMQSSLMRRLAAKEPLSGGFQSALGSFLYFSAVTFLVGHEAGHHLGGHDGHYAQGAHAEQLNEGAVAPDEEWQIRQALERDADFIGLTICRMSMAKLLAQLWDVNEGERLHDLERQSFHRALIAIFGTGALAAAIFITPSKIQWNKIAGSTHPPAVARVTSLLTSIFRAIKENFPDLDDTSQRWIRVMCLEVVVGATIQPGTDADRIYQERQARGGEPAALRATGIRQALYDPTFHEYLAKLDAAFLAIKPRLRPRR